MKKVVQAAILAGLFWSTGVSAQSQQGTRESLAQKYPSIDEGSTEPENKKVLCPFLRMLARAGLFDEEAKQQSALTVGIIKVANAAREFACSFVACGGVASLVSAAQLEQGTTKWGAVNLEALHTAGPIAHDCGLTFAKGGTEVDDAVRADTLRMLREKVDAEGRLRFPDLQAVQLQICESQGVSVSLPGRVEIGLIFSFLGGNERGFIDYDDVDRFLHAELPLTLGTPGTVSGNSVP